MGCHTSILEKARRATWQYGGRDAGWSAIPDHFNPSVPPQAQGEV